MIHYEHDQRTAQADASEEQAQEAYERIYAEVEAEHRAEWAEYFGDDARFPFKPNGPMIHAITVHRMIQLREDD